ncbi:MAG: hypothetical protein AB8H79_10225 [Myxococcota bacterium]
MTVLIEIDKVVLGGDGECMAGDLAELQRAESRLGGPLPQTYRNLYLAAGYHKAMRSGHNRILAPAGLYEENGGIVFMEERQNVMFWAFMKADIAKDDPPIFQGNDEEDEWYIDAHHMHNFLIGSVCWHLALALPASGRSGLDTHQREAIEAQLRPTVEQIDTENDLLGLYAEGLMVSVSQRANTVLAPIPHDALHCTLGSRAEPVPLLRSGL